MFTGKTVGVIGAGNVVFNAHLPLLKALGCKVEWILDTSEERAAVAADGYGIRTVLGADELRKSIPTEIVLIACPYGSRAPYYEFLSKQKGAIYIEKPVARTVLELDEICRLRPDYAIAAGFAKRSMGVTNIVKGLIEDGMFGRLRHVRAEFGTATIISAGAGFARDVGLSGGGQLIESAIHNIDAVCYMADIKEADVHECSMTHENNFDLHTDARIKLTDGGAREIEMELLVTCFYDTQYEIKMRFDNADLSFSLFRKTVPEVRTTGRGHAYQILDHALSDYPHEVFDVLYVFWREFLAGVEASRSNYTNASSTRVTTSIIEQLYKLGTGSAVLLNTRDCDVNSSLSR
jgi:predicted dehydrogenase